MSRTKMLTGKIGKFCQKHVNNIIGVVFYSIPFLVFVLIVQSKHYSQVVDKNKQLQEEMYSLKAVLQNDPAPSWLKQVIENNKDSSVEFKMAYINPAFEDTYRITNEYYEGKTDFDIWDERIANLFYSNDLTTYKQDGNGCYKEIRPPTYEGESVQNKIVCRWIVNRTDGSSYVAGRIIEFNKTKRNP